MKLQPDSTQGPTITGYGSGWVAINGEPVHASTVVCSTGQTFPWECDGFEKLGPSDFEKLIDLGAELVIFGSGSTLRFPHPQWLQGLYDKRIGVETMDTQAACRTYNFLAGEGRKVVAALLIAST